MAVVDETDGHAGWAGFDDVNGDPFAVPAVVPPLREITQSVRLEIRLRVAVRRGSCERKANHRTGNPSICMYLREVAKKLTILTDDGRVLVCVHRSSLQSGFTPYGKT